MSGDLVAGRHGRHGNLLSSLLRFASLQGPKTGTTTFMVSRAPFGQNGNRLAALFNWVTQVGFEIVGIYFVVATVILLFSLHGTNLNGPAKIGVIIIAALIRPDLRPLPRPGRRRLQLGDRHSRRCPGLLDARRAQRTAGGSPDQPLMTGLAAYVTQTAR